MDLKSSLRGFSFNGKHNHDMDVVMHSKTIQSPSKNKIKETVPFMNGSYDFSTVTTNGEIAYGERQISIELGLNMYSKEGLQTLYSKTMQWIVDIGRSKLIFDDDPDYYYIAEVESSTTLDQVMEFGKMSITFIAYPFKTSVDNAGEETWDLFNFELDYMQDVEFDIDISKTVSIYNCGRSVCPLINCSSTMTLTKGSYTTNLLAGDNKDWLFKLQNGVNSISINGTGHIKFTFRKEML